MFDNMALFFYQNMEKKSQLFIMTFFVPKKLHKKLQCILFPGNINGRFRGLFVSGKNKIPSWMGGIYPCQASNLDEIEGFQCLGHSN